MRRLLFASVIWAVAFLPLLSHAQLRGGVSRGPAVSSGPRVSPGFRSGPAPAFGARPAPFGARPATPFGARPVVPGNRAVMGSPGGRVFVSRPPAARGRVFTGRPFVPSGRVVPAPGPWPGSSFVGSGFHHGGHVIFTTNPFAFGCGGFFPCNNAFFNPFFFSGSFFGSPFFPGSFFPGSFWPGSFWGANYIPGFSSDYYYPQPPAQQEPAPAASSDNSNDIQLAIQMQRLTDEVEQLRADQLRQHSLQQVPGASMSAAQPAAATTFVFRDGHRLTAKNYAIAGQTLWIFSEHMAKKVPIADLDRAATEELNAANGVEVHLPEAPRP